MSFVFWISDDGTDWGRSSVDRHGRTRVAPPEDAQVVSESHYREHLADLRRRKDREIAAETKRWMAEPLRPSLVVAPAGSSLSAQIALSRSYASQARAELARLSDMVKEFLAEERVSITGRVETDGTSWAEIIYDLGVEPLPPSISAISGRVIHDLHAALDQAHKVLVPPVRAEGRTERHSFPIPAPEAPGGPGWEALVTRQVGTDEGRLADAIELLDDIYGTIDQADWNAHPMRRLRALAAVEQHQSIARVAAIADVRGDSRTRVYGVGLGDDFVLPNREDGTQHRVRFPVNTEDREQHVDRLRDLITRCQALEDDDISFAMYEKDEELAELQRELDSWYSPFTVEVEMRSAASVVAAGSKGPDLVTELSSMCDFVERAISRYATLTDRS